MRPQLFVVAVAVVLLAAACGGSSDDEALRAQIAALQAQVDAAEGGSELEQRLKVLEEQLASPKTSPAPTQRAPVPSAIAVGTRTRYVANTGGVGVSVRSACRDSARTGARAWAEGVVVQVEYLGTGGCNGWALARLGSGGATSWIRDRYLS